MIKKNENYSFKKMERYIIRSEDSASEPFNFSKYGYEFLIMFMKEFYKYRNILDYNSWIYIITTTYNNKPIVSTHNSDLICNFEITDQ